MFEYITAIAIVIGAVFLVLAALATLRMPDVYCRLSASTKAVTFGAGMMLFGAAFALDDSGTTTRALAGVAFYFVTSPIAAHVLARAAHLRGTKLWEGTIIDELSPMDEPETGGPAEEPSPRSPEQRDAEA